MRNRLSPFWQLLLVRVREFYREPAVIFWVYGFPLFLALGLGVAFSGGVSASPQADAQQNPPVDVQGSEDDPEARSLAGLLRADGLPVELGTPEDCRRRLQTGKTALVVVPGRRGYEYVYDPTRPGGVLARYRVDDVVQRWKAGRSAWPARDRHVEEPGSRYIDFLIPGLMGLNLVGGGLWGVGFVIVDLRMRRLLKWMLATPMRRSDFLLSVLASRVVFLVPEMLFLALAGHLLFGTPIRGNPVTLILIILVGGSAFAGLGLLLASRSDKTETVSGLINLLMLPMWMLCGTFFSPARFPAALQPLIRALPLTHLNDALRAVMLDGDSLAQVSGELAVLAAWAVGSFLLAFRWFRWFEKR